MVKTVSSSIGITGKISGCQVHFGSRPNTWVKLHAPVSNYSHDEALLLCEAENGQWQAWIPDHGSVLLNCYEFYVAA